MYVSLFGVNDTVRPSSYFNAAVVLGVVVVSFIRRDLPFKKNQYGDGFANYVRGGTCGCDGEKVS